MNETAKKMLMMGHIYIGIDGWFGIWTSCLIQIESLEAAVVVVIFLWRSSVHVPLPCRLRSFYPNEYQKGKQVVHFFFQNSKGQLGK